MHQAHGTYRKLKLELPATLDAIEEADDCMCAWLKPKELPLNLFGLRILLHEALLNAVTHGSQEDPSLTVSMSVELRERDVVLHVEDAGPGFDWARPRPMDTEGYSGRGMSLMQTYANQVDYNDAGNCVTLYKNYEPAETADLEIADTRRA